MRRTLSLLLFLLTLLALAPTDAEARRRTPGFAIINTGEEIFETGPLPASVAADYDTSVRAGYKCSVFGVFWAYGHWWGCEPVAFTDEGYTDDPVLTSAIASAYDKGDMQIGFWGRYGRFLLVLGVLGYFFLPTRRQAY
jgi:hypothetical protein